jgi:hypothetical protein
MRGLLKQSTLTTLLSLRRHFLQALNPASIIFYDDDDDVDDDDVQSVRKAYAIA